MKIIRDAVFKNKKNDLKSTIAFLEAIKKNISKDQALIVANEAAANYMVAVYEEIFVGTEPGTQERFNVFREFYNAYSRKTPYCEVLVSTDNILKVRYKRCPYAEVLFDLGLSEFAHSSCLSDKVMTKKLLPGVVFTRDSSIVGGSEDCFMIWEYRKVNID